MSRYLHEEGLARDAIPNQSHALAVRWWYVHRNDDGYIFARGGRVATARRARTALHNARVEHRDDERLSRNLRALTHRLGPEGELLPLRDPKWSIPPGGHEPGWLIEKRRREG